MIVTMTSKVAFATEGGLVSAHFGHAPVFLVVTIEDGRVLSREEHPNPGHVPGALPKWLAGLGATCVVAGGMGEQARRLFEASGIRVVVGASGNVEQVLETYLSGTLSGTESFCSGSDTCGDHSHHAS